jgi:hypothetical protein
MFLKEKFTADGEFDRMKARLVAGGDRQPPEHAEETAAAPTMGTSSLFIILALRQGRMRHRQRRRAWRVPGPT